MDTEDPFLPGPAPVDPTAVDSFRAAAGSVVHTVSGPSELVEAIPYLLGFRPAESLVLVGLNAGRLIVTARADLPADGAPLDPLAEVVVETVSAMAHGGTTEVVSVVWDAGVLPAPFDAAPLPRMDAVAVAMEQTVRAGCAPLDAILTDGTRFWSYACRGDGCCPPEGRVLPETMSAFAAASTYAGVVVRPSREALGELLEPVGTADRERLLDLLAADEQQAVSAAVAGDAERRRRSVKRAVFAASRASDEAGWTGPGAGVDDDTVSRFGVALLDPEVLDAVLRAVDDERLDGRELWRELARRLPAPYDAAPLVLYAWCSWRHGDGALASLACERAVRSRPDLSLAEILLTAVTSGVDPHARRRGARGGGAVRGRRRPG